MTARLAVVREHHPCVPAPACVHEPRWTCECGQTWLRAGAQAWVPADWLTYPRAVRGIG